MSVIGESLLVVEKNQKQNHKFLNRHRISTHAGTYYNVVVSPSSVPVKNVRARHYIIILYTSYNNNIHYNMQYASDGAPLHKPRIILCSDRTSSITTN